MTQSDRIDQSFIGPKRMPEAFARIGDAAGGVPVVVGGLRSEAYGFYNTLAVIGADGVINYSEKCLRR